LGSLPADQNLCPKRQHRKLDWILHATLIFTKAQKTLCKPKRLLKKWTLPIKTINEPKRKFSKT